MKKTYTITLTGGQLNMVLAGLETRASLYTNKELMSFDPEAADALARSYNGTAYAIREQFNEQRN